MKYIEVSKRVRLTRDVSEDDLIKVMTERLHRAFDVSNIKENDKGFNLQGTSGGGGKMMRHAAVDLNVQVVKQNEICRIMVCGTSKMSKSLVLVYSTLFFLVMLVGLLPGSIDTNGETSGALDTLVLLIFGIFLFFDVNKKIEEPKDSILSILDSLETEFG
ncbi:MAG: hypothetical protein ACK4VI_03440 [Alphaproteobacteria bacterium]